MSMLLDSCIVIDVLRGRGPALDFITSLPKRPFLSVVSISELRTGERDERDRKRIDGLLAASTLLDVDREVAEIAGSFMHRFYKSHGLDTADALIAATAARHGLALATLNLKHFPMFPELARPYEAASGRTG